MVKKSSTYQPPTFNRPEIFYIVQRSRQDTGLLSLRKLIALNIR